MGVRNVAPPLPGCDGRRRQGVAWPGYQAVIPSWHFVTPQEQEQGSRSPVAWQLPFTHRAPTSWSFRARKDTSSSLERPRSPLLTAL